jgi:hypothetical protein
VQLAGEPIEDRLESHHRLSSAERIIRARFALSNGFAKSTATDSKSQGSPLWWASRCTRGAAS